MYKMKEVCEATGLTEKTVRFYVEQKLVEPKVERGLHYRSYSFSDGDIQRLLDISALRSADFSVTEIRRMLENPNSIPGMIAEKETFLSQKITTMEASRRALENLTIHERTDLSQVADAIEPRSVIRKETPKNSRNRLLWLGVYLGIFLIMCISVNFKMTAVVTAAALLVLTGIHFPLMALGYFRYNHRNLPNRGGDGSLRHQRRGCWRSMGDGHLGNLLWPDESGLFPLELGAPRPLGTADPV